MIANFIQYGLPSIISLCALIISIKAWHKNRVYYDLDIHRVTGIELTGGVTELQKVKDKLNTGKYTIVTTYTEVHPNNTNNWLFVLLGRIKK